MNINGTDLVNVYKRMIIETIRLVGQAIRSLPDGLLTPILNALERILKPLEELLSEIMRIMAPSLNQIFNHIYRFLKQLLDCLRDTSNNLKPISSLIPSSSSSSLQPLSP